MDTTNFNIDEKNFEYKVDHSENNATSIKCIHKDDFYVWSLIVNNNVTAKSDNLNFLITPFHLFNLLRRYKNATLDKVYDFKFPETYDTPNSCIILELHFKLPHDDLNIIVPFYLRPCTIPESERFDKKLLKLRETMTTDYNNDIATIKDAINKLSESDQFVKKNDIHIFFKTGRSHLNQKFLTLEKTMQTDIVTLKDEIATLKNEISKLSKEKEVIPKKCSILLDEDSEDSNNSQDKPNSSDNS